MSQKHPHPHVVDAEISPSSQQKHSPFDLNYWVTKLFLNNPRLTTLLLIFLVATGIFATLNLKTTGFPPVTPSLTLVQTLYPGASSEQVSDEVTIPLEGAIKNVDGVTRFNSTSNNSFSNITVYIDESKNVDSVKNKIDSAIKGVTLPDNAETPKLVTPEFADPSVILAVVGKDQDKLYNAYQSATDKIDQIAEVSKVEKQNELDKKVVVKLKGLELLKNGLSVSDVQNQLATIGETIPAISDVNIDGKNASITTSVKGKDLDTLKNLNIPIAVANARTQGDTVSVSPVKFVKLSDIADIQIEYVYEDNQNASVYSFYDQKEKKEVAVQTGVLFIRTVQNTDLSKFVKTLKEEMQKIDGVEYITRDELTKNYNPNKTYIVEAVSVNDDNQEQVNQVIGGLIGSKIGDSAIGNLGYLLGGIQLIILIMIVFVSWRAALISATAIPLSLMFSIIYVWLIGEQLNTLVLFSLVLVCGLVTDPALVIIEAIQRKINTGLKGKEAVLAAVQNVGSGVFLAALTNIIVFAPFGILSGIFGQIFRYIPLTIVPAVIGSYIVPLVFLTWFGNLLLKPGKNKTDDEEKNLWPVAKWLISFNYGILKGPRWIRLVIIVAGLVVSLGTSAALFSNSAVKQVQFAQADDSKLISINGSFLPTVTKEEKVKISEDVATIAATNKNVTGVVSTSQNAFGYQLSLTDTDAREQKAKEIAKEIDDKIQQKYGEKATKENRKFFDVRVSEIGTGGPATNYEISLTLAENDPVKLRDASLKVGKTISEKLCYTNKEITIKDYCNESDRLLTKVDDGFTDKDNLVYSYSYNRDSLIEKGLGFPGRGPLTIAPNQIIKNLYQINDSKKVATVLVDQKETEVILEPQNEAPTSTNQLDQVLTLVTGPQTNNNLYEIVESKPGASVQRIRGQTVGLVQGRMKKEYAANQGLVSQASDAIVKYYNDNDSSKTTELGLDKKSIKSYDDGSSGDAVKAFSQLGIALLVAILVSYIVLAVFFNSLSQPLGILYTIPLSLIGALPALAIFAGGQFGFLEVIGLIILVGIVENVAIFLIDAANQKVDEGWELKRAISYASGVRFTPVVLTSIVTLSSLAPLAISSPFYRSISVVIIFGIFSSGLFSLVTTPILFIFFKWMSAKFLKANFINKIGFLIFSPIYLIVWGIQDRPAKN